MAGIAETTELKTGRSGVISAPDVLLCAIDKQELVKRLSLIYEWYEGMVREETGRLAYMYYPEYDAFDIDSPIRDIGSIWDIEVLSNYLKRQDLQPLIERSLSYYGNLIRYRSGYAILDSNLLQEPSGIAHNAFMILALASSDIPGKMEKLIPLAGGILRQQRDDGSYKIYFGGEKDDGLELYPAEAMLALMTVYRLTRDRKYLTSVERGFYYYKGRFYERDMVEPDTRVFFANWQSQFSLLLFQDTENEALRETIKGYLFSLHDRIIENGFYGELGRHSQKYSTVEVACALEGLNDAYSIALVESDSRVGNYHSCICAGLSYLRAVQCMVGCTEREKGGFGLSIKNRTQRIDVTGHAASALMKSLHNGIYHPVETKSKSALSATAS